MQVESVYPVIVTDNIVACRGPEKFNGQGMFFTLQVADAAAEFEQVRASGARIAYELRDEPWGQRRFGLVDPSGTWVDVVQQIDPAAGFWDPYMR